jgi:SAM-dependent methyltransferase/uncharacterized protein YbaR (Trm112 family)
MEILVCPGCRTATPSGDRIDVRTLSRDGDLYICECGRRYPIVGDVPAVFAEPPDPSLIVERELAPDVAAALAAPGPDDAPYPRLLEHLSIYLDAHWGDRADPPAGFASEALVAKLAERAGHRVALAVELGCSAGRMLAELARGADHVVGVDIQHGVLRRAARLLDGEPVAYARRMIGRTYAPAVARAGDRAVPSDRRTLICGDALDPPLIPGAYRRVVALNLLDCVRQPRQLLTVLDALCAHGGEVIVSSPYAWQSAHVDEDARIGGADPAGALRALFERGLSVPYTIEDEAELPWTLRRDARSTATYCIHYLRARKG